MHREHQDRRRLVVQAKPADEREPAKRPDPQGQIDNNYVGLVRAIQAEAVGKALRLDNLLYPCILQQLPAAL